MDIRIHEDRERMKDCYTRMGSRIASCAPEGWTHVALGALIDRAGEEHFFVFTSLDAGENYRDLLAEVADGDDMDALDRLMDAQDVCRELRRLCAAAGDVWTMFCLLVNARGEFQAKFGYEPFDRLDRAVLEEWKAEYLYDLED